MRRSVLGPARPQLRNVAVGAAIAIGVFASIATSNSTATTHRTPWFYIQGTDLSTETSEVVRFCPEGEFRDPSDPVTYELTVRGEGLQPATASVPVLLSVDGYPETALLNIQWPDETRRRAVSVTRDPEADNSDCTPWARVTIGPLAGEPGDSAVQLRLAITAEVLPGRTGFGKLEFGGAQ